MIRSKSSPIIGLGLALVLALTPAAGVILYRTDDPLENRTAPQGALLGSGWQYEGHWGSFLGTAIGPNFFISAAHVSNSGPFHFMGVDYTIVRQFFLPGSDFVIVQVLGPMPSWAPLYEGSQEAGQQIVVFGRGTRRGQEVKKGDDLRGWKWGADTGEQRWGENLLTGVYPYGGHDLLYATFDEVGLPEEGHLSAGDSGGAIFLQEGMLWKLAGINFAVTGPYDEDNLLGNEFQAAMFDSNGYYITNGASAPPYILDNEGPPSPGAFFCSRISSELSWIYSVTDPTGDNDADGMPNLLEHALKGNPVVPDVQYLPTVQNEGSSISITYRRNTGQADLVFEVEKSNDLVAWVPASPSNQITPTLGGYEIVKASVPVAVAEEALFLRLKVSRP